MTPRHSGGPSAQPLSRRWAVRPNLLPLEDRSIPSVTNPLEPGYAGDASATSTDPTPPDPPAVVAAPLLAVGSEAGNPPRVKVYDTATGQAKFNFLAYDASYKGGVRVATGDVSGDGVADIITAPGPGSQPLVKVFDGETGAELKRFLAYDKAFRGGVFVAAGDINGDGHADVITAAGESGGPHVKVYNGAWIAPPIVIQNQPIPAVPVEPAPVETVPAEGDPAVVDPAAVDEPVIEESIGEPMTQVVPSLIDSTTELLTEFMAYDERFRGGARVTAGDVNHDGHADIITAAGIGGGPHIRVFDGVTFQGGAQWMAYASTFTGGVYVTAGDLDGDGKAEVVTGTGNRGATHVKVFRGETAAELRGFTAAPSGTTASVRVAIVDYNHDGRNDLLTAFNQKIQVRDGQTNAVKSTFIPFDAAFRNGLFMG